MDATYFNDLFDEMELELIASQKRNLKHHLAEEETKGFEWTQWQTLKLQSLRQYQKDVLGIADKYFQKAQKQIKSTLMQKYKLSAEEVDKLMKKLNISVAPISDNSFFRINNTKLKTLIDATTKDFNNKKISVLRQDMDIYRQIIYRAQMYANTGVNSTWQAVDKASKDFLDIGLSTIKYKNGANVPISSWAEMSIRTAGNRASLIGTGERNAEYGNNLIKISQYGACSETCQPWQGKVYWNDVIEYGGSYPIGSVDYPLLSNAIENGLFHPNCRHTMMPYFPGISEPSNSYVSEEQNDINYQAQQKQRYMERQIRKYKREAAGSLDNANIDKANTKIKEWQGKLKQHIEDNPQLKRERQREQVSNYGANPMTLKDIK